MLFPKDDCGYGVLCKEAFETIYVDGNGTCAYLIVESQ